MKITCIAPSRVPSDTANSMQVMKACQALAQLGHAVDVLVPVNPETEGKTLRELAAWYGLSVSFRVRWLPARQYLKRYDFAWRAVRLAQAEGSQLVYTWMPQAAVAARWVELPVILEMHDRPTGRLGPLLLRTFTRSGGKKRLVTITRALLSALEREQKLNLAAKEMVIAPNGVELDRYRDLPGPSAARAQLGLPENITVGYTGHFYRGRGMQVLEDLAKTFPGVNFLWVGGAPPAVEEWRGRLASQGLTNVSLTGFVENTRLPLYQAAADVLLMPYERVIEGSSGGNSAEICSPMKMFEYMAAGRAILSSDLPVLHEVLDTDTAIFCPPEEPSAWERALSGLLENPLAREAMGRRAALAVEQYTWLSRAAKILAGW